MYLSRFFKNIQLFKALQIQSKEVQIPIEQSIVESPPIIDLPLIVEQTPIVESTANIESAPVVVAKKRGRPRKPPVDAASSSTATKEPGQEKAAMTRGRAKRVPENRSDEENEEPRLLIVKRTRSSAKH